MYPIIPDDNQRMAIEHAAMSGSCLCWTCSTCDSECPINMSTGRLRPQVIVRMANFGMLDELLAAPQIWYCLGCQRCGLACPNKVKPFELMHYLRSEMIRTGRVDPAMKNALCQLIGQFQRVRYRAIQRAMRGEAIEVSEHEWYQWLERPIRTAMFKEIEISARGKMAEPAFKDGQTARACLTCSECSTCCPIFYERATFDPQSIIRMVNLGLTRYLLKSPSIWLCLDCRQCTQTCSQMICGHQVIRRLRSLAVQHGYVPPDFPALLFHLNRQVYPRLLDEIDNLTGMYSL